MTCLRWKEDESKLPLLQHTKQTLYDVEVDRTSNSAFEHIGGGFEVRELARLLQFQTLGCG